MTFKCTLNARLKKIVVVAAKSKQYTPFWYVCGFYFWSLPLGRLCYAKHLQTFSHLYLLSRDLSYFLSDSDLWFWPSCVNAFHLLSFGLFPFCLPFWILMLSYALHKSWITNLLRLIVEYIFLQNVQEVQILHICYCYY